MSRSTASLDTFSDTSRSALHRVSKAYSLTDLTKLTRARRPSGTFDKHTTSSKNKLKLAKAKKEDLAVANKTRKEDLTNKTLERLTQNIEKDRNADSKLAKPYKERREGVMNQTTARESKRRDTAVLSARNPRKRTTLPPISASGKRQGAPASGKRDDTTKPSRRGEKTFAGAVNKAAPPRSLVTAVHRTVATNRAVARKPVDDIKLNKKYERSTCGPCRLQINEKLKRGYTKYRSLEKMKACEKCKSFVIDFDFYQICIDCAKSTGVCAKCAAGSTAMSGSRFVEVVRSGVEENMLTMSDRELKKFAEKHAKIGFVERKISSLEESTSSAESSSRSSSAKSKGSLAPRREKTARSKQINSKLAVDTMSPSGTKSKPFSAKARSMTSSSSPLPTEGSVCEGSVGEGSVGERISEGEMCHSGNESDEAYGSGHISSVDIYRIPKLSRIVRSRKKSNEILRQIRSLTNIEPMSPSQAHSLIREIRSLTDINVDEDFSDDEDKRSPALSYTPFSSTTEKSIVSSNDIEPCVRTPVRLSGEPVEKRETEKEEVEEETGNSTASDFMMISSDVATDYVSKTSSAVATGDVILTSSDVTTGDVIVASSDVATGDVIMTSSDVATGDVIMTSSDDVTSDVILTSSDDVTSDVARKTCGDATSDAIRIKSAKMVEDVIKMVTDTVDVLCNENFPENVNEMESSKDTNKLDGNGHIERNVQKDDQNIQKDDIHENDQTIHEDIIECDQNITEDDQNNDEHHDQCIVKDDQTIIECDQPTQEEDYKNIPDKNFTDCIHDDEYDLSTHKENQSVPENNGNIPKDDKIIREDDQTIMKYDQSILEEDNENITIDDQGIEKDDMHAEDGKNINTDDKSIVECIHYGHGDDETAQENNQDVPEDNQTQNKHEDIHQEVENTLKDEQGSHEDQNTIHCGDDGQSIPKVCQNNCLNDDIRLEDVDSIAGDKRIENKNSIYQRDIRPKENSIDGDFRAEDNDNLDGTILEDKSNVAHDIRIEDTDSAAGDIKSEDGCADYTDDVTDVITAAENNVNIAECTTSAHKDNSVEDTRCEDTVHEYTRAEATRAEYANDNTKISVYISGREDPQFRKPDDINFQPTYSEVPLNSERQATLDDEKADKTEAAPGNVEPDNDIGNDSVPANYHYETSSRCPRVGLDYEESNDCPSNVLDTIGQSMEQFGAFYQDNEFQIVEIHAGNEERIYYEDCYHYGRRRVLLEDIPEEGTLSKETTCLSTAFSSVGTTQTDCQTDNLKSNETGIETDNVRGIVVYDQTQLLEPELSEIRTVSQ